VREEEKRAKPRRSCRVEFPFFLVLLSNSRVFSLLYIRNELFLKHNFTLTVLFI
jgi:hypothetical protein